MHEQQTQQQTQQPPGLPTLMPGPYTPPPVTRAPEVRVPYADPVYGESVCSKRFPMSARQNLRDMVGKTPKQVNYGNACRERILFDVMTHPEWPRISATYPAEANALIHNSLIQFWADRLEWSATRVLRADVIKRLPDGWVELEALFQHGKEALNQHAMSVDFHRLAEIGQAIFAAAAARLGPGLVPPAS